MSVILDALKKAQEERKRPVYRDTGNEERRPNRSRTAFYVIVGAVVCAILFVVFLPSLYRMQSPGGPHLARQKEVPPPPPPPVTAAKAVPETPAAKSQEVSRKEEFTKFAAATNRDTVKPDDAGAALSEKKASRKAPAPGIDAIPQESKKQAEARPQELERTTEKGQEAKPAPVQAQESTVVVKRTTNERAVANYNSAVLAAERGNIEEAKKLYLAVLTDEPHNIEALNNLGVMAMSEGNTKEAATYFRRILEYRKDYAKAYNNLGIIALREGDRRMAEEYFRKAIEVAPQGVEPYLNLAALLRAEKRLEEANSVIDAPLRRGFRVDQLYLSAALIKDELGQYDEAAKYYRQYLQVSSPKEDRRRIVERLTFLEQSKSETSH